jgi:hypothetical protein
MKNKKHTKYQTLHSRGRWPNLEEDRHKPKGNYTYFHICNLPAPNWYEKQVHTAKADPTWRKQTNTKTTSHDWNN